jgi:translation initiation factor 3 subunit H
MPQVSDDALREVQIDGQVLLKVLKHCKECMPSLVTGQLLGLDIGSTLEVTSAFPFPVRSLSMSPLKKWVITRLSMPCRLW